MASLDLQPLPLPGLAIVRRQLREDERGHFSRIFCPDELRAVGWHRPVQQINHSATRGKGTVRGLHFQRPPHTEAKLVACVRGVVWDVALDLRVGSPTFMQWHAERLSADNAHALFLPAGFAHGFQAMSDDVELIYVHDGHYVPEADEGLHPLEPRCAVRWPLPVVNLSDKDRQRAPLAVDFVGITP